jgi:hypothetical protein
MWAGVCCLLSVVCCAAMGFEDARRVAAEDQYGTTQTTNHKPQTTNTNENHFVKPGTSLAAWKSDSRMAMTVGTGACPGCLAWAKTMAQR